MKTKAEDIQFCLFLQSSFTEELVKPQKSCSILGTLTLKDETIKYTFLKLDQHFYLLLFVCWDLKQYSTLQEKVTDQLSVVNLAIHEFLPKTNTESTEVLYNFYIVQSEGTEEDTPKLTTVKRTKKSPILQNIYR